MSIAGVVATVHARDAFRASVWHSGLQATIATLAVIGLHLAGLAALDLARPRIGHTFTQGCLAWSVTVLPSLVLLVAFVCNPGGASIGQAFGVRRPIDSDGATWRMALTSCLAVALVGAAVSIWLRLASGPDAGAVSSAALWDVIEYSFRQWWLWAPMIAVAGPFCEELVFRGWLFDRLQRATRSVVATVFVTSVVFVALHFPATVLQAATLLGMAGVFGLLRARCGSIWPGVLLHSVWNGVFLGLMAASGVV